MIQQHTRPKPCLQKGANQFPSTIYEELEDLVTERIIPYWPHRRTKRRKKPIFVRIEIDRQKVREMTPEEILGLKEEEC
jgi:hypothetical protein